MGARVPINGSWYKSFAAVRRRCASSREPNADRVLETYLLASAPGVVLAAVETDSGFACNAVPVVADLTKWATTFAYEFRDETSPPRPYMNVPPLSRSAQVTRRTCLTYGRARRSPRSHRRRWRWRGSCLASGRTSRPPAIRTARLCRLAALRPTFAPSHRLPDWRTHRRDQRRRLFARTPLRAVGRARSGEGAVVMSKRGSIRARAPQARPADLRSRGAAGDDAPRRSKRRGIGSAISHGSPGRDRSGRRRRDHRGLRASMAPSPIISACRSPRRRSRACAGGHRSLLRLGRASLRRSTPRLPARSRCHHQARFTRRNSFSPPNGRARTAFT
jgi:hypothetical protein